MQKLFILSMTILLSSAVIFAQQKKSSASKEFTKAELLAFPDVKALLSAINSGQDYSVYLVRNFNLSATITKQDGTQEKLSESGPGGTWSEKQKNMINQYAIKGAVFTLENIIMVEKGKKGVVNQPSVSFSIKE